MGKPKHFHDAEKRFLWRRIQALEARMVDLEKMIFAPDAGVAAVEIADEPARQALQETADELSPDAYYLQHHGKGWYTVHSGATGDAVHEGKLRKPEAEVFMAEVVNAANG